MIAKREGFVISEGSKYKGKNYYLRHKHNLLPPVEYIGLDEEIERAGLP